MKAFGRLVGLAALFVATSSFADPATFQDTFLDQLVGRWVLRGEIAGKQTTHDVTAEWVLGHQYLRLHEVSREKNSKGQPAYEAMVFIGLDPSTQEYACLWLDSTATSSFSSDGVGRAKRAGDEIPFVFRDAGRQVSFRNTFSYNPKTNSWAWLMYNVKDGKDILFGRVTLARK